MSSSDKKQVTHLVEHELALKVYLDSLLFDDPLFEEEPPEVEQKVQLKTQVVPDVITKAPVVELHEVVPQPILEAERVPVQADRPGWSEGAFECLMFKVAGSLTLSVPLIRLNGIVNWEDNLTFVPGHAEWFLGVLKNRGKQVKVIDIAKFVIPQNHQARQSLSSERQFKEIILIDDGQFGIACDGLGDVLKLTKEQVRWRSDRSSRPWLAGTVIEHMCALIDLDSFISMLKDGGVPDDISSES